MIFLGMGLPRIGVNDRDEPEEIDLTRLEIAPVGMNIGPYEKQLFLRLIGRGVARSKAASLVRIDIEDVEEWMQRGMDEGTGKFREFYLDVQQAEAIAQIRLTMAASSAATKGDWKAAAHLLKRYPTQTALEKKICSIL